MRSPILAILGSPRKGGNTEVLLEAAADGARQQGAVVEAVRLNDLTFSPCQNCGGCAKTGRCVLDDDLTPLYARIDAAEGIILASPIYFYGVSAQTKAFIDRMQAFWTRKYRLERSAGAERPALFLSVAATYGAQLFAGAVLEARYGLDAMGFRYAGELLVGGVDARGAMARRAADLSRASALGAALAAGRLDATEPA